MRRQRFSDDKVLFYRNVFALVLPMALQNLINVAVTSADVIMLGKVGEIALSAGSLAGQIYFILSLILFGLTSGAAVITAQYWGKKDIDTIEKVLGISMCVGVSIGILFFAAAQLMPETLMKIFTSEQAIIEEGVGYLKIVSWSYPMAAAAVVYLNIMRSVEHVIVSTVVYSVSLLINIIFNGIFIFGLAGAPAMGVAGAALATLIAHGAEIVFVILYAIISKPIVHFRWKYVFSHEKALIRDFGIYALPVLLNELAWGTGISAIAAIIGHLGSAAVAANSITQVTRQLAMVVTLGVANAAAIILGRTIGEKKEELALIYADRLVRLSALLGVIGSGVVLCVSPLVRQFMSLTPEASGYVRQMMMIMAAYVLCQAVDVVYIVGAFRAGGDTRIGLLLDGVSLWGVCIPLGFITAFILKWPVWAVYLCLTCDEMLKLPFSHARYRSRKWLKNITR
nr:MATE family efflux transporter [Frisingicoccus sp.]